MQAFPSNYANIYVKPVIVLNFYGSKNFPAIILSITNAEKMIARILLV